MIPVSSFMCIATCFSFSIHYLFFPLSLHLHKDRCTALTAASLQDDATMMKFLLEAGAIINTRNEVNESHLLRG